MERVPLTKKIRRLHRITDKDVAICCAIIRERFLVTLIRMSFYRECIYTVTDLITNKLCCVFPTIADLSLIYEVAEDRVFFSSGQHLCILHCNKGFRMKLGHEMKSIITQIISLKSVNEVLIVTTNTMTALKKDSLEPTGYNFSMSVILAAFEIVELGLLAIRTYGNFSGIITLDLKTKEIQRKFELNVSRLYFNDFLPNKQALLVEICCVDQDDVYGEEQTIMQLIDINNGKCDHYATLKGDSFGIKRLVSKSKGKNVIWNVFTDAGTSILAASKIDHLSIVANIPLPKKTDLMEYFGDCLICRQFNSLVILKIDCPKIKQSESFTLAQALQMYGNANYHESEEEEIDDSDGEEF